MDSKSPLPLDAAARTLLGALAHLSRERRDVKEALQSLHSWLGRQLDGATEDSGALREKVVQPGDGRRVITQESETPTVELTLVQRRARWKAAALRFAVDRRAADDPADAALARIEEGLRKQRTELPDCFPWMLDGPMPLPDDAPVHRAAEVYEALARTAEVANSLDEAGFLDPPPPELLYMLAEAQSMLLVAVRALGLRGDSDQRDLFAWLKEQTTRHRIYVDRHMRLDDPADPTLCSQLLERLEERAETLMERGKERKARAELLSKLRYHVRRGLDGGLLDADRESILQGLDRWRKEGLPHEDRELVEILAPLASEAKKDTALQQALALHLDQAEAPRQPLEEVRYLLEGQNILCVTSSGDARVRQEVARDLVTGDVRWVELADGSGMEDIASTLETYEAAIVLLGVRLDGDAYNAFKDDCLEKGTLFVRLPDGFAPEHVARQVIRQVGWRLRQRHEEGTQDASTGSDAANTTAASAEVPASSKKG